MCLKNYVSQPDAKDRNKNEKTKQKRGKMPRKGYLRGKINRKTNL